jgi:hypothetical protein
MALVVDSGRARGKGCPDGVSNFIRAARVVKISAVSRG